MKTLSLLVSLILTAPGAFASQENADIAPVLKCPAVPEAYSKMITELNFLKTSIKQEAACAPLNNEVRGLETLLGQRRDAVKALIEKSKTAPLTDEELTVIRFYVEDVTKKVFSTAELFNRNNHCFIEDKKNFSFADLSSITLDATALAKTIAGPWATPIALGGHALARIFEGLNTVVKNQRGYDFTRLDQRQRYVQSLCAYYNYRQDIDYLLYPEQRVASLRALEGTLTTHLKGVVENCPECSLLAKKTVQSLNENGKGVDSPAKLNEMATKINGTYVRALGTQTVRTLTTLKWINGEIAQVSESVDDNATIGRDFLSEIKADIDGFIFEKEAPKFVTFQANKSLDLFHEFRNFVRNEGDLLMTQATAAGQGQWVNLSLMNETDVLKTVAAYQAKARAAGLTSLAARIAQYTGKSVELFNRTRIAAGVTETYCAFFQRAGVYTLSLQVACEGMAANAVRRNLKRQTNNELITQPVLPSVPQEYVTEWVDSLSKTIEHISQDPSRFKKKNGGFTFR